MATETLDIGAKTVSKFDGVDEIPNPKGGPWTIEEALDSIQDGIIHDFSVSKSAGGEIRITAKRYKDRNLGLKTALQILQEFGISWS